MRKLILLVLLAGVVGCGAHAQRPLPQDEPTPRPTPTPAPLASPTPVLASIPSGTNVQLDPGLYACPAFITSGTHITGHGSISPPEMLTDTSFAPFAPPAPVVRILCPNGLTLSNITGVELSGVVFDFAGASGLILDGVSSSRFELGIVNSNTGLLLQGRDFTAAVNVFPRLVLYETQRGIVLQGVTGTNGSLGAVTWNDFGQVSIVHAHQTGIVVSQFADSNTFRSVRINGVGATGVVFNDKGILGDVDASGNVVSFLNCDGTVTCVDFRGYTIGNYVTVGFGIMPDANKIKFANAFSQAANTVVKLQEVPKIP